MTVPPTLDPNATDYADRVFDHGRIVAEPHVRLIAFQLVALGGSPPNVPEKAAEFGRFVLEELTQAYVQGTTAGMKAVSDQMAYDQRVQTVESRPLAERAIEAIQSLLGCLSDEDRKAVLEHVLEGRSL